MLFHRISIHSLCWVIVHPTFPFDRHCQFSALAIPLGTIQRLMLLYQHRLPCGLVALPSHAASLPWPIFCKATRSVCPSITAMQNVSLACMSSEREGAARETDSLLFPQPHLSQG